MKLPPALDSVCLDATIVWGQEVQEKIAIGEIGELLTLFGRREQRRDTEEQWVDEIADGIIMLHQLAHLHNISAVEHRIAAKVLKLEQRINKHKNADSTDTVKPQ